MKYLIFIIYFSFLTFNLNGQCPDLETLDIVIDKSCRKSNCYNVRKNVKNHTIDIVGGYLHNFDSISVYNGHKYIFKGKIDKKAPELDGPSFVAKNINVENVENLIIELDDCNYEIDVFGVGKIILFNLNESITFELYCSEKE